MDPKKEGTPSQGTGLWEDAERRAAEGHTRHLSIQTWYHGEDAGRGDFPVCPMQQFLCRLPAALTLGFVVFFFFFCNSRTVTLTG